MLGSILNGFFIKKDNNICVHFSVAQELTVVELGEFELIKNGVLTQFAISQLDTNQLDKDKDKVCTDKWVELLLKEEFDFFAEYILRHPCYNEFRVAIFNMYYTTEFEKLFNYSGELGVKYTKQYSEFKVWAPLSSAIKLNLYDDCVTTVVKDSIPMTRQDKGVWYATINGDLNGVYYDFSNAIGNKIINNIVDPYARAVGVNGKRGMVVDLLSTNPSGWDNQNRPTLVKKTDAIIYELHVRDFSINPSSGISAVNRGKYLAFTEKPDTITANSSIASNKGLDYIHSLGVTDIHLNPVYDFGSIDERVEYGYNDDQGFNWGYDPMNFNVPEGSYSSNPYNGATRITEFKSMIQAIHNAGMRVVLDVVYNHVYSTEGFCINQLVPNFAIRTDNLGNILKGSGCDNELASERYMMSKYIVDSLLYWQSEYKIDGFRFDLMGLIDTNTLNTIATTLKYNDPSVLLYGEGWTAGSSGLAKTDLQGNKLHGGLKENTNLIPDYSVFNDVLRNCLKGAKPCESSLLNNLNTNKSNHYKNEVLDKEILDKVMNGLLANQEFSLDNPRQSINYNSSHDDYTFSDHIALMGKPILSTKQILKRQLLGASIVFMSQGIPFLNSGEEFLRTKPYINISNNASIDKITNNENDEKQPIFNHNSYKSNDDTNSLKWYNLNDKHNAICINFYKTLIYIRKCVDGLKYQSRSEIADNVKVEYLDNDIETAVLILKVKDTQGSLTACFNASNIKKTITLQGTHYKYIDGEWASTTPKKVSGKLNIKSMSAVIILSHTIDLSRN